MDQWSVVGIFFLVLVLGCGLGHELWKINETLERIANILAGMSEKPDEEL